MALSSAIIVPLSQANEIWWYGNPALGLIAYVPLYIATISSKSLRESAGLGALFGAVSTILSYFWLANFGEFSLWTIGGVTVVYTTYNGVLNTVLGLVLKTFLKQRPLIFGIFWTGYELVKSIGFLGFPWGLAAYPFSDFLPLVQIADITGVYGISFIVLYLNAFIAEVLMLCFRNRVHPTPITYKILVLHLVFITGLLTIYIIYGYNRLAYNAEITNELDVLMVQQNSDAWVADNQNETLSLLQRLTQENTAQNNPDLVVWSESSLRNPYQDTWVTYYDTNPTGYPFNSFLSDIDVPLLTGAPYTKNNKSYNSTILFDRKGNPVDHYSKQQLVPFAERVPFWNLQIVRDFYKDVLGLVAIWSPGDRQTVFQVEGKNGPVRFATPICFEDSFSGITQIFSKQNVDLFINLTNDAWSKTNSAQLQHFISSKFRTIETRTTMIRSTNAGVTGVIDPWGKTLVTLPMFTAQALRTTVPIYNWRNSPTIYTQIGNSFGWLLVGIALILLAFSLLPQHLCRGFYKRITDRHNMATP
ncbi:apolipoprotein N-acyltransferase [Spirochaeta lutea]|uniref:apolipoprotein N-acyltransferase n=1 Tax=Spirochaeta lutea TaxID=1480694 RepID=UPI00138E064B|nr:apolipoprotein N-acyltransferase [Spirochaeta lutea]